MNQINQAELYEHLSGFLKAKGIELKRGSYTQRIQRGCTLLSDAINLSQKGLERAKAGVDKKLDQMRQVIHEKTAPKPPPAPTPSPNPVPEAGPASRESSSKKRAAGARRKSKKVRASR